MTAGLLAAYAYLTVDEAARCLGCSDRRIRQRIESGDLPTLRIESVLRVEARAVDRAAPDPVPAVGALTIEDLAFLWRCSERTVRRALRGDLGSEIAGGVRSVRRRELLRWVLDHTTGEDLP